MSSHTEPILDRALNWDDRLQYAEFTDVGMRRLKNQDSRAIVLAADMHAWRERGHFFMVADGMGAHAAGELASKLAVDGVQHLYYKYAELSPPDALQKAVVETNGEIHRRGQINADFHNMGTTASALLLLPQGALVAHIGDSRVYRLRSGVLEQLTRDHSLVWELREQLSENSEISIPKNVITRSLGPNATVQPDIEGPLPLARDDTFLLCSDGLTGRVTDEELGTILAHLPPQKAVHLLIDLANLRGGPDNITVVVAKVVSDDLATVNSQPLKLGGHRGPAHLQPAMWVGVGVCLLGAILLAILANWLLALAATLGALIVAVIGLVARHRRLSAGIALSAGRRLGKGPYTETRICPPERAAQMLKSIVRDLRGSNGENRSLDWSPFDARCRAAEQAENSGQPADALQHYASAIRFLMEKVREQQNKRASDSSIDY